MNIHIRVHVYICTYYSRMCGGTRNSHCEGAMKIYNRSFCIHIHLLWIFILAMDVHICCGYSYLQCIFIFAMDVHICYACSYLLWKFIFAMDIHICYGCAYLLCIFIFAVDIHICYAYSHLLCIFIFAMNFHIRPPLPPPISCIPNLRPHTLNWMKLIRISRILSETLLLYIYLHTQLYTNHMYT